MLTVERLEDRLCCDAVPPVIPPAELLPPPTVVPALPPPLRLDLGVPDAAPQVGPLGPYPAGAIYPGTDAVPSGTVGQPMVWPAVAPAPLVPITIAPK